MMPPIKIYPLGNAKHIDYQCPVASEVGFNAIKQHLRQEVMADTAVTHICFNENTLNKDVLKQLVNLVAYRNKNKSSGAPGYAIEGITIIGNPFTGEMATIFKKIL